MSEVKKNRITKKTGSFSLLNPFKGDRVIWIIFFFLTVISLVSVFSSIGYEAFITKRTPQYAFFRHAIFVIATYIVVVVLSNFDYRKFAPASWFGYLISIALLFIAMIVGSEDLSSGSGMGRFINLPLIGRFQPSEFAKIVLVVYLARLLAMRKDVISNWKVFRNVVVTILLVVVLIFPQNFSTAAIIAFVCFIMLRVAPVTVRHWRLTVLALLTLAVLSIVIGTKYPNIPLLGRAGTWSGRIDKWLNYNTNEDVDGTTLEVTQENMARMAVASGRFFGVGVGSTVQARLMTQANNDMIFSIIVEETGMAGGCIVLILYIFLYIRCMRVAWRCKGYFGRMTVFGLGTLIFFQACIHMCVSVGALPVTGQTLPLISSGGSAYLCMGLAIGIIQSVAFDEKLKDVNTESVNSESLNNESLNSKFVNSKSVNSN